MGDSTQSSPLHNHRPSEERASAPGSPHNTLAHHYPAVPLFFGIKDKQTQILIEDWKGQILNSNILLSREEVHTELN